MTKLILIRHGQTDWNLKKKYCGFTDIPINATGSSQAGKLRRRLEEERVDKIYASDRIRAIQTARIIFPKRKINQIAGLEEMSFGVFEGLNYAQIMRKYPRIYRKWLNDPYSVTIPRGESLASFGRRITRSLNKVIHSNKDKIIAVICHGGSISVFMNKILKARDFWEYIPDSGSINIIEYKTNKPKIKVFNSIS